MRHRPFRLRLPIIPALLAPLAAIVCLAQAAQAQAPRSPSTPGSETSGVSYRGLNAAGGEFAPGRIPGEHGRDYIYPRSEALAQYAELGANVVRLPVRWERLQPALLGPLSPAELAHIDRLVDAAEASEILLIVDLHNYGRYRGEIVTQPHIRSGLADLWSRIAARYAGRNVAFGIMNEPHGFPARQWRRVVEETIAAIRGTGADNLVLVPGTRWTGAHSWLSGGEDSNALAVADLADDNVAIEVHQYLDGNSSGTSFDCVGRNIGRRRLEAVTGWLRDQGRRGFLGEFAGGHSEVCQEALAGMIAFMDANADVWLGWTYWAGGPWWNQDYQFDLEPVDGDWPADSPALREALTRRSARPAAPSR